MANMYVKVLTGHMHYGSPYETSSDCGNCDGARCDRCREAYDVYDENYDWIGRVSSKDEDS